MRRGVIAGRNSARMMLRGCVQMDYEHGACSVDFGGGVRDWLRCCIVCGRDSAHENSAECASNRNWELHSGSCSTRGLDCPMMLLQPALRTSPISTWTTNLLFSSPAPWPQPRPNGRPGDLRRVGCPSHELRSRPVARAVYVVGFAAGSNFEFVAGSVGRPVHTET